MLLRSVTLFSGADILPHEHVYNFDERKVVDTVYAFPFDYGRNKNFLYGTFQQRVVGTALLPAAAARRAGWIDPSTHYRIAFVASRLANVVLGGLTVWVVFRLGVWAYDRRTAWFAALLMAGMTNHVTRSGGTQLDPTAAFWMALGALFAGHAAERLRYRDFAGLGLCVGVLLGTKVNAAAFLVVPLALGVWALRARGRPAVGPVLRGAGLAAALALPVFALSTPEPLLYPGEFLAYMQNQKADWVERFSPTLDVVVTQMGGAVHNWLGWWLLGLVLLGLPRAWPGRGSGRAAAVGVLLLAAVTAYFFRGHLRSRFLMGLAPFAMLVAARPLAFASAWRAGPAWRVAGAAACTLSLSVVLTNAAAAQFRRLSDPRPRAAAALPDLVPAGRTIFPLSINELTRYPKRSGKHPRLDTQRNPIVTPADDPDFVVAEQRAFEEYLEAMTLVERPAMTVPTDEAWRYRGSIPPLPVDLRFFAQHLIDDATLGPDRYVEVTRWGPRLRWGEHDAQEPTIRLYRRVEPAAPATTAGD